jgi:hypothetical protein
MPQASRDLCLHQSQLRGWVKVQADGPAAYVPRPRPNEARAAGDRAAQREVTKLKAERDILNLFDDRSRRRLLDEPLSQRAGQCGDRELLPVADHRAYSAKNVSECDEAEADVFDYIEYFYNPRRRPSTIG